MSSYKPIKQIIPAQRVNMGGHLLDQPLPAMGVDQIDPFLLIHHWDQPLPGGQKQQEVGVGPHPHRGFSPVTFVYKGTVHHRDSRGHDAVVHAGGTQWMHAGMGITHSERPGADLAEQGGENEFIQFWVNSPAKHKMEAPSYLPISAEETPKITQAGTEIAVVAGTYADVKGPASTFSPLLLLRVKMEQHAKTLLHIPAHFNALLYLLDGKLEANGTLARAKDMVWFEQKGDSVALQAQADTRFIVLAGEPIQEEVTHYGPFVMNTQTEILEALRDAQMGKMGVLVEGFD